MGTNGEIIKNILFLKIGGIPLIYLKEIGDDTYLISGYLEAFKNFSSELENAGELRSINLSNITFSYFSDNPEFYIISINDSRVPLEKLTHFLEDLHGKFIKKYSLEKIKKWNKKISYFKDFIPVLINEIKIFSESIELSVQSELMPYKIKCEEIFQNPNIFAFIITDIQNKNIRTYANPSLDDFELQVFIASPYINRILLNFIPMLANTGSLLLDTKGSYYILKSERFFLGMKQKEKEFIGILGENREEIKDIIKKI